MKKFVFAAAIIIILTLPIMLLAAESADVEIKYAPPCLLPDALGGCPEIGNSIINYLIRLYSFAVGIAGILALGMIVAGAIMISVSGAVDKKKEGKDMIQSAIWGIVLLLGSYLILNTINPRITQLSEPGIVSVSNFATSVGQFPGITIENLINKLADLMVDCNILDNDRRMFMPITACADRNWPFVRLDEEGQVVLKDNGHPDYKCEDVVSMILEGNIRTAVPYNRLCQPTDINLLAANSPKIYAAFYAEGKLTYKKKLVETDCAWCQPVRDTPIKKNSDCSLIDEKMSGCVCIISTALRSEPLICKLNSVRLGDKLQRFKNKMAQEMTDYKNKWRITEAWPPTVFHGDICHFNGTCFDMTIDTNDCAIVEQFKNKAKDVFGADKVLDEWVSCGGIQTATGIGNHFHIQL